MLSIMKFTKTRTRISYYWYIYFIFIELIMVGFNTMLWLPFLALHIILYITETMFEVWEYTEVEFVIGWFAILITLLLFTFTKDYGIGCMYIWSIKRQIDFYIMNKRRRSVYYRFKKSRKRRKL